MTRLAAARLLPLAAALASAACVACTLPRSGFGRPCGDDDACDDGDRCFDGACVPPDFALLPRDPLDAGPDDAGASDVDAGPDDVDGGPDDVDAGPAEGEGEGEGEAGEGEGEGEGEPRQPGEGCPEALPLTLGVTVAGETTGFGDDSTLNCSGGNITGTRDVVYALDMPPDADLHVVVTTGDGSPATRFFVVVKLMQQCLAPPDEVVVEGGCAQGNLGTVDFVVPDPPDGPLFLIVDGLGATAFGAYTLRATAE